MARLRDLAYPVLSDAERTASISYGVYNLLGDNVAAPSVFIIDTEGLIRWQYIGKDIADRPPAIKIIDELAKVRQNQAQT